MARGEISWSAKGKKVDRFKKTTLPRGDYQLKIVGDAAKIKQGDKPGSLPYISLRFQAMNTGAEGAPPLVFHNLFLHLGASPKDGKAMVDRAGGVADLAQALGDEPKFGGRELAYQKRDAKGEAVGGMQKMPTMDAQAVLKWIKAHDGDVVTAFIKVEKREGWDEQNRIDYFHPAEESSEEEAPAETDIDDPDEDDDLEEDEEDEDAEDDEEDLEDEEDEPTTSTKKAKK